MLALGLSVLSHGKRKILDLSGDKWYPYIVKIDEPPPAYARKQGGILEGGKLWAV